jgi:hypothetical protein
MNVIASGINLEEFRASLKYCPETGVFTWARKVAARVKAGSIAGYLNIASGYWQCTYKGRSYQAHRLAFLWMTGVWPSGEVDHINGEKSDNRWANLRDVSRSENCQNQRRAHSRNVSSGLLGVSWNKRDKRWCAAIRLDGKRKHLGYFLNKDQAHLAYLEAKRQSHAGCTI